MEMIFYEQKRENNQISSFFDKFLVDKIQWQNWSAIMFSIYKNSAANMAKDWSSDYDLAQITPLASKNRGNVQYNAAVCRMSKTDTYTTFIAA